MVSRYHHPFDPLRGTGRRPLFESMIRYYLWGKGTLEAVEGLDSRFVASFRAACGHIENSQLQSENSKVLWESECTGALDEADIGLPSAGVANTAAKGRLVNEFSKVEITSSAREATASQREVEELRQRVEQTEVKMTELAEKHSSETAMLLREVLKLKRITKIDATNMGMWKNNVSDNLATLNSKQSTAEIEATFQKQLIKLHNEREAIRKVQKEQLTKIVLEL